MRKTIDRTKTKESNFEVLWRFVYCDGVYRTLSKVLCQLLSGLYFSDSKRPANMKNKNLNFAQKSFKPAQKAL